MRLICIAFFLSVLTGPAWTQGAQLDLKLLAAQYVKAQEAVYEQGAGPAQLDALLSFYASEYAYYHPAVEAKVTGLDNVRRGTSSHLGETADAEIKIKGILVNENMVSLALEESFTVVETGKKIDRPRMTVLTFKGDKIIQRVDM